MIVFGLVACGYGLWTQCGAMYDKVNHYNDMQACVMHQHEVVDNLPDWTDTDKFKVKAVCIDWHGEKKKIVPFLMMMGGYHAKVDA